MKNIVMKLFKLLIAYLILALATEIGFANY